MHEDGQAFHTPQAISGYYLCKSFLVPLELAPMVNNQLDMLTDPLNWHDAGVDVDVITTLAEIAFLDAGGCMLAQIAAFALQSSPAGWLLCDGSTVAKIDYPELADVIDAVHLSGDDIILPDLTGRIIAGDNDDTLTYNLSTGTEFHTLTINEIPAHDHDYQESIVSDVDLELAGLPQPVFNVPVTSATTETGGDAAHNNMPPVLVLNWFIFAGR